jgi:hypothetical protein
MGWLNLVAAALAWTGQAEVGRQSGARRAKVCNRPGGSISGLRSASEFYRTRPPEYVSTPGDTARAEEP